MTAIVKIMLSLKGILTFGLLGVMMLFVWNSKRVESAEKSVAIYKNIAEIELNGPKWIKVESCYLDILSSSYDLLAGSKLKEIYIPINQSIENDFSGFYLHTKDTSYINIVKRLLKFNTSLNALKNDVVFGKEDSEYLDFKGATIAELEEMYEQAYAEYLVFFASNPPRISTIEGVLNPKFSLSEHEKYALSNKNSEVHIIREGPPSKQGLYYFFLLTVGCVFVLLAMLSLVGLIVRKKTA